MWNLTGAVGKNSRNAADDVELVRYGYGCMRDNGGTGVTDRDFMAALRDLKGTGAYGPDLQRVIEQHQRVRGRGIDGHITPIPTTGPGGSPPSGSYGSGTYIILGLSVHMGVREPGIWPRIDRSHLTGPAISQVARNLFAMNFS